MRPVSSDEITSSNDVFNGTSAEMTGYVENNIYKIKPILCSGLKLRVSRLKLRHDAAITLV